MYRMQLRMESTLDMDSIVRIYLPGLLPTWATHTAAPSLKASGLGLRGLAAAEAVSSLATPLALVPLHSTLGVVEGGGGRVHVVSPRLPPHVTAAMDGETPRAKNPIVQAWVAGLQSFAVCSPTHMRTQLHCRSGSGSQLPSTLPAAAAIKQALKGLRVCVCAERGKHVRLQHVCYPTLCLASHEMR